MAPLVGDNVIPVTQTMSQRYFIE